MVQVELIPIIKDDMLSSISKLRENLENNAEYFLSELADETASELWQHYDIYADDGGNHNFDVRGELIGNLEAQTIADGDQILFVEYGAGDLTATPFSPGDWSSSPKGKQQYSKHGFWWYQGRKYESIPPARGIPKAYEFAMNYIDEHGMEVFE